MIRSRTIQWDDPHALAAIVGARSGADLIGAISRGELPPPPIAKLLGMTVPEVAEGRVVFRLEPGEEHYNPIGSVHGGIAATMLDSAMACAAHTTLPAGTGYTTLELKVNFVRPISVATGPILAEATVVHRGGTIITAEGRVTAERDGALLAHGTSTQLVMAAARTQRDAA